MGADASARPELSPSAVGQFFRLQSCPMYLQWRYDESAKQRIEARDWETSEMSPVLSSEGDTFEITQLEALSVGDRRIYGIESTELDDADVTVTDTWPDDRETGMQRIADLITRLDGAAPSTPDVVVHQPHLSGHVGAYEIGGKGDMLRLRSTSEGVRPTIYEVKSSSKQKVHHRYQGTIYGILLQQLFDDVGVEPDYGEDNLVKIVTPDNDLGGTEPPDGFPMDPYRAKLELKLQPGGSFDQTILGTDFESTTNRIARRCSGCEYEPLCMTRGVEDRGLELLGLQAGTQETLHRLGIHDIEDFANLFDHPEDGSVHWEYSPLEPTDPDLVQRVRREADVSNLQKRAQIAYRFLAEIDDDYGRDGPDFFPHPLRGTGNNLPEDEHGDYDVDLDEWWGADYPSGSLVRVYLYVQQDHAQDRVTLMNGFVACSLTGKQRRVVELPNDIPTSTVEKDAEENRLFQRFFGKLTTAIAAVAPDWTERTEFDDLELDANEGFLHLFLYSEDQREALMDAIRRHPQAGWQTPLRTLLGVRQGIETELVTTESRIDQEMVSVLQDDFRKRWALRFPGLGAVQTVAQFNWDGQWFDWRGTRDDGEQAKLDEIFRAGLFDSTVKYSKSDGDLSLDHSRPRLGWRPDDKRLAEWVYPIQNREATGIPVEYIWGLHDRLDPDAADDPEDIHPYLYRSDLNATRIDEEDVDLLADRFSRLSHHIERTIQSTSKFATDKFVTKRPIDLERLQDFSFEPRSLDDVCVEYQYLEFDTIRTEMEGYYRQPLEERLDTGNSLAFECTHVDEDNGVIEGRLLRSDRSEFDPKMHGGVTGGPLSVGENDFMVLTRLLAPGEFGGEDQPDRAEAARRRDPASIKNSTTVVVSEIDEDDGTIRIEAGGPFKEGWPRDDQYLVNHRGWETNPEAVDEEWTTYVAEQQQYVLDPSLDQITQNRAYEALQNAFDAPVRRWIRQIYERDRDRVPIDPWTSDHVEAYVDRMEATDGIYRPNEKQEALVTDIDHGIVMLQGPPGTGKTEYTVAPAVLSRLHSAIEDGDGFLGAVSAVSHTAVDEALESIVELHDTCPAGDDGADQVEFVRIRSGAGGDGFEHPNVREIYYNSSGVEGELEDLWEEYFAPDAPDDSRAIFFAPPVSIRSFLNAMLYKLDHDDLDYENIAGMMQAGDSELFDLAVVDEASMMDLPLSFLIGSFVTEDGQFMLVGDHRQMQPIQRHEWEDEDREPIERHTPFLSALDFLRYIRKPDEVELEFIQRELRPLTDPDETLPVHRLAETHRLPEESARMHTDLFYEQDGIELVSAAKDEDLPAVDGPIGEILDTDDRITLLVHDEGASQKTNPVEQALITDLLDPIDIREPVDDDATTPSDTVSAGVVVPFRAQRRDVIANVSRDATVDTVERFQGGERDLMILSMTASDRGYISQISEFLLDPNRFNVGASRMKRKLIVIASAGLFEESSDEVDRFEEQEAWIRFYQAMGGLDDDYEEIELRELISDETWNEFVAGREGAARSGIQIYSGYSP